MTNKLPIKTALRDENGVVYVAHCTVFKQESKKFKEIKKLPRGFHLNFDFRWMNPELLKDGV